MIKLLIHNCLIKPIKDLLPFQGHSQEFKLGEGHKVKDRKYLYKIKNQYILFIKFWC